MARGTHGTHGTHGAHAGDPALLGRAGAHDREGREAYDAPRCPPVDDRPIRARAMRAGPRPATYAEIAAAIGVSKTTARRWTTAPATPLTRQPRRSPICVRCAGPGSQVYIRCRLCRSVLRHVASARRIMALIAAGTEPRAAALRQADPTLREIKVELILRQMRATGSLPAARTGPRDLAHPTIVRALAEGHRTSVDGTTAAQREAATIAAGCILAERGRSET